MSFVKGDEVRIKATGRQGLVERPVDGKNANEGTFFVAYVIQLKGESVQFICPEWELEKI